MATRNAWIAVALPRVDASSGGGNNTPDDTPHPSGAVPVPGDDTQLTDVRRDAVLAARARFVAGLGR